MPRPQTREPLNATCAFVRVHRYRLRRLGLAGLSSCGSCIVLLRLPFIRDGKRAYGDAVSRISVSWLLTITASNRCSCTFPRRLFVTRTGCVDCCLDCLLCFRCCFLACQLLYVLLALVCLFQRCTSFFTYNQGLWASRYVL